VSTICPHTHEDGHANCQLLYQWCFSPFDAKHAANAASVYFFDIVQSWLIDLLLDDCPLIHRRRNRVNCVGRGPYRFLTAWAAFVFGPHGIFNLLHVRPKLLWWLQSNLTDVTLCQFKCLISVLCDFQACFRTVRERGHSPLPRNPLQWRLGRGCPSPTPTPSRRLELESHRSIYI